jgi:catechol 2,3-dioxygenase-like lactoylglutathione lyase family enzyme
MLKDHDSSAIVAVADLDRARAFYSDVLRLELADEGAAQGVLFYRTGATRLIAIRGPHVEYPDLPFEPKLKPLDVDVNLPQCSLFPA